MSLMLIFLIVDANVYFALIFHGDKIFSNGYDLCERTNENGSVCNSLPLECFHFVTRLSRKKINEVFLENSFAWKFPADEVTKSFFSFPEFS